MNIMKKIRIIIIMVLCTSLTSIAQEKLNINLTKSSIKWQGEYTFYFGGHEGTINFSEGHLIKTKDLITGGNFTIDMNTLVSTDIEASKAKKSLEDHLKDSDFFDVAKYPIATLSITKVEYSESSELRMEANLTIKGITKLINFRAFPDYTKKQLTTKFKIDRRRWNVNYNSKIRDGAISDAIGFEVILNL